jgi:hypothetical protein
MVTQGDVQPVSQQLRVAGLYQQSVLTVDDYFCKTSNSRADDGTSCRKRFQADYGRPFCSPVLQNY